jgi:hypothetical protein
LRSLFVVLGGAHGKVYYADSRVQDPQSSLGIRSERKYPRVWGQHKSDYGLK